MSKHSFPLRGLVVASLLIGFPSATRSDWTQWRGPNRDGHAAQLSVPDKWPDKLDQRWKVEVGIGHASPLIAGDSVYVFSREGEDEVARCLSLATGKEVWKQQYPAPYEMNPAARGHGKGPKATPLLSGGRLYTFGISGILSCFDAKSGKPAWRKEFSKQFSKTSPEFGAAASPLADNGLVFAHVGGKDQGALTAFDARSGDVKWQWKGDGPSYASPIIATVSGAKQLVTQTQKMIVALDPGSGKLLWSLPFTTPYEQNIITPIQNGDLLVFGGLQQPTFAVRVAKNGDDWKPERVWETRDASFYMSTPVLMNGKLYGMAIRGRGTLVALDAASGKLLSSDEGRVGDNASLLSAGSYILVLPVDGVLRVLRPGSDSLIPVTKYALSNKPTWAMPALDRNHILVKDQTSLVLWDLPAAAR